MDSITTFSENRHRASYLKTTNAALLLGIACGVILLVTSKILQYPWREIVALPLLFIGLLATIVSISGLLVLFRHARDLNGKRDPFFVAFSRIPRDSSFGWRRWCRIFFFGAELRPGDLVMVRDAPEIRTTLDAQGKLDEIPFMPEMLAHCGHVLMVDRRVDKINDWIAGNDIRRMKNVVTLVNVRCSGAEHGGCQAACQILWNERWLRRWPNTDQAAPESMARVGVSEGTSRQDELSASLTVAVRHQVIGQGATATKYTCQITELPRASTIMSKWDIRQDLRPLLNGNLSIDAFLIAMLTSVFNAVQVLRGGSSYPVTAPQLDSGPTPVTQLNLRPGEKVRVRSKHEIGLTLVKNHNRGMWFGREIQRHCGRQYTVRSRIDRIIDERSGELRELKTPGIILDRVTGTGEYLRFCAQNEYVFWREIWLERVDPLSSIGAHCRTTSNKQPEKITLANSEEQAPHAQTRKLPLEPS